MAEINMIVSTKRISDFEFLKIETWKLFWIGGGLREVVAHGGSTVQCTVQSPLYFPDNFTFSTNDDSTTQKKQWPFK